MGFCDIDWKIFSPIIAALIASCTALYISNKWRKQKGSEVIAIHSKETLIQLTKLTQFFANSSTNFDPLNLNLLKEEFDQLQNEIITRTDFLFQGPIPKSDRKRLLEFLLTLVKIQTLYISKIDSEGINLKGKRDLLKKSGEIYIEEKKPIIKILMNYALYKVNIDV